MFVATNNRIIGVPFNGKSLDSNSSDPSVTLYNTSG